ncbi:MAG: CCA tRNA nucleotidyltransferase [Bdellovibrionota bacterium]
MRIHRVDWYHHLPLHVKGILDTLKGAGHEAYLVGGSVRDLWLGLQPKDFDLVSGATPDEVEALFPRTEGVGRAFGIMIVITDQGPVEVARFRADAEYKDGRHPTGVVFSSPEEDAKRRDFTINALFCDPVKGEVIDYVGGVEDLTAKKIRCVGDAETRFEEDSLRMLRAARFHSQLAAAGFALDPSVISAVRKHAARLSLVSRERVTQEVSRILLSSQPSVGLFDLVLLDLWQPVFACTPPPASIYANFDTLGESFLRLSSRPAGLPLFMAAAAQWFTGWDAEKSFVLTREAKAALKEIPPLISSLRGYTALSKSARKQLLTRDHIFEAIAIARETADDDFLNLLDLAEEERAAWSEAGTLTPAPLLTGADLLAAGFKPGPEIKALLDRVRRAQLEGEIQTREDALTLLRRPAH